MADDNLPAANNNVRGWHLVKRIARLALQKYGTKLSQTCPVITTVVAQHLQTLHTHWGCALGRAVIGLSAVHGLAYRPLLPWSPEKNEQMYPPPFTNWGQIWHEKTHDLRLPAESYPFIPASFHSEYNLSHVRKILLCKSFLS